MSLLLLVCGIAIIQKTENKKIKTRRYFMGNSIQVNLMLRFLGFVPFFFFSFLHIILSSNKKPLNVLQLLTQVFLNISYSKRKWLAPLLKSSKLGQVHSPSGSHGRSWISNFSSSMWRGAFKGAKCCCPSFQRCHLPLELRAFNSNQFPSSSSPPLQDTSGCRYPGREQAGWHIGSFFKGSL